MKITLFLLLAFFCLASCGVKHDGMHTNTGTNKTVDQNNESIAQLNPENKNINNFIRIYYSDIESREFQNLKDFEKYIGETEEKIHIVDFYNREYNYSEQEKLSILKTLTKRDIYTNVLTIQGLYKEDMNDNFYDVLAKIPGKNMTIVLEEKDIAKKNEWKTLVISKVNGEKLINGPMTNTIAIQLPEGKDCQVNENDAGQKNILNKGDTPKLFCNDLVKFVYINGVDATDFMKLYYGAAGLSMKDEAYKEKYIRF